MLLTYFIVCYKPNSVKTINPNSMEYIMADSKTKKYKFNRPGDRIVTTTSAVASVAALGAGLSVGFNPIALGVAGGIALVSQVTGSLTSIPAYKRMVIKSQVKKGTWQPVPADAPAIRITAEISKQLGRKEAPEVYTVDAKTIAKFALPFGMRWMMKLKPIEEPAMKSLFVALVGANTIITTKQALENGLTEDQLRFIAAHEMSHLHAKDQLSPSLRASGIVKKVTRVMFWGSLGAIGASVAGVTLPVLSGSIALAGASWAGSYMTAKVINNFGMRKVEQRADRNGVFITRDLENAKDALKIDPTSKNEPRPVKDFLKDLTADHPFYNRRIKILTKAYNKITRLHPLPGPAKLRPVGVQDLINRGVISPEFAAEHAKRQKPDAPTA